MGGIIRPEAPVASVGFLSLFSEFARNATTQVYKHRTPDMIEQSVKVFLLTLMLAAAIVGV